MGDPDDIENQVAKPERFRFIRRILSDIRFKNSFFLTIR